MANTEYVRERKKIYTYAAKKLGRRRERWQRTPSTAKEFVCQRSCIIIIKVMVPSRTQKQMRFSSDSFIIVIIRSYHDDTDLSCDLFYI